MAGSRSRRARLEGIARANPAQDWREVVRLLELLAGDAPRIDRVLEIGSHKGGSARVWRDEWNPEVMVCVNHPDEFEGDMRGIIPLTGRFSQDLGLVDDVRKWAPFDFLFIDGGHTYREVEADFENFAPMVRAGGVVAFHDVLAVGDVTAFVMGLPNLHVIEGRTGIGVYRA